MQPYKINLVFCRILRKFFEKLDIFPRFCYYHTVSKTYAYYLIDICSHIVTCTQWRTQEKFQGVKVMAGLVGGPGAEPPDTRELSKNFKRKFLKKIAKNGIFSPICKKISKACVKFSRVWTKPQLVWEILRKVWNFLMKIQ